MKSLPLNELYLFCKVIQAQGYNNASKVLNQSPATLSRAIKKLEDKIGEKLLHRNSQNFKLTAIGEQYYEKFLSQVNKVEFDFDLISQGISELKGDIRISCPEIFMSRYMHKWSLEFMQKHPDINIHIIFSMADNNYIHDNIDLAIVIGEPLHNQFIQKLLTNRSSCLVATQEYLNNTDPINKLSDLRKHALLDFGSGMSWNLIDNHKKINLPITAKYRVGNGQLLLDATLNHMGVALVSVELVKNLIDEKKLVRVLPNVESDKNGVYLLFKDRTLMSARVNAFKRFIIDKMHVQ